MVYVESKVLKGNTYYYHTRSIRVGSKIKKIRRYIGKNKVDAYKLNEFKKSVKKITEKELDSIINNYTEYKLTYSQTVMEDIFRNNIMISNLREFDSNIDKEIEKEFPIEFIYNSNNIEGSKIPFEEVRRIVLGQKVRHKDKEEIKEAENSVKAYDFIKNGFKFNIKSIKELHKILTYDLHDEKNVPYYQGFKEREIVVGKMEMDTTHPSEVQNELKELLDWYDNNRKTMFVPELAFKFYFKYEKIHPFEDGNGRTGRLIMNKILLDAKFQPMIIYQKNKDSHQTAFIKGRTGNFKSFMNFMFKRYRANYKEFYLKFIPKE